MTVLIVLEHLYLYGLAVTYSCSGRAALILYRIVDTTANGEGFVRRALNRGAAEQYVHCFRFSKEA